ncbi:hypothetical protein Tcan_01093, partial [Toxocara canis]
MIHMDPCASLQSWQLTGCFIDLYLLPTVCLLGLGLNIACLVVFSVRRQHPLVPSLIVLSLCDSLQLFLSLLVLLLPTIHEYSQAERLVFFIVATRFFLDSHFYGNN